MRELEAKKRLSMLEKVNQRIQMQDYMGEVRMKEDMLKQEKASKVQNYRSVLESQKRGIIEPLLSQHHSQPSLISMESPGRHSIGDQHLFTTMDMDPVVIRN